VVNPGLEEKSKKSQPDWWLHPDNKADNAELNDGDDNDVPDGWEAGVPGESIFCQDGDVRMEAGGWFSQSVDNNEDEDWIKEYAFKILYRTQGFEKEDKVIVEVIPTDDNGDPVPQPAAQQFCLKRHEDGSFTETCSSRFDRQPAKETIKVRHTGELGERVLVKFCDFRTDCKDPKMSLQFCPFSSAGSGEDEGVSIGYDPATEELSFSGGVINILNEDGSFDDDSTYIHDLIRGAAMTIGSFTLDTLEQDGIWFKDGTVTIHDTSQTYFQANITRLWIDDEADTVYGLDVFGDLFDTSFDLDLGSVWLGDYVLDYECTYAWPRLSLRTSTDLEQSIRDATEPVSAHAEACLGSAGDCTDPAGVPRSQTESHSIVLRQNHPNPFISRTAIVFGLEQAERVKIEVFNLLGQRVTVLLDEVRAPGQHIISWDIGRARSEAVAPGIYFYRLSVGSVSKSRKMIVLR
jgi:hypothetical protein